MPKFFCNNISDNKIKITGDDARHIFKVLRMNTGDTLTVCDMNKTDYLCRISDISKSEVLLDILSKETSKSEEGIKISVFQALPKASKMDYIIQKCVELGAYEIYPVIMSRCVVRLENEADAKKKTDRWQAVSEAAAKQSMRGIIPKINLPLSFNESAERLKNYDACFVCYENEKNLTLKSYLTNLKMQKSIENAAFLIGPEGGISDSEIDYINRLGIKTITLGTRILRTETASTAVISMLNYEFDK